MGGNGREQKKFFFSLFVRHANGKWSKNVCCRSDFRREWICLSYHLACASFIDDSTQMRPKRVCVRVFPVSRFTYKYLWACISQQPTSCGRFHLNVYCVHCAAGTYDCSSGKIPEKSKSSAETIEFRNRRKNSIWIISGRQIQYIMHFRKNLNTRTLFHSSDWILRWFQVRGLFDLRLISIMRICYVRVWEISHQMKWNEVEYCDRTFSHSRTSRFSPLAVFPSPALSPGQYSQFPFRTHSREKKIFAMAFAFIHSPWIANDVATDLIVSLFRFMVDNDDDDYTYLHAVISVKAWEVKFCVCVLDKIVQIQ